MRSVLRSSRMACCCDAQALECRRLQHLWELQLPVHLLQQQNNMLSKAATRAALQGRAHSDRPFLRLHLICCCHGVQAEGAEQGQDT